MPKQIKTKKTRNTNKKPREEKEIKLKTKEKKKSSPVSPGFLGDILQKIAKEKEGPSNTHLVNVAGLDRKVLLRKLWDHASPCDGYMIKVLMDPSLPDTNEFYVDQVESSGDNGYINYAFGRLIKSNVYTKGDYVDPTYYDNEWGRGSFQNIVHSMGETKRRSVRNNK